MRAGPSRELRESWSHREGRVLPQLILPHPSGAVVEIYLQGAHVSSWKRSNGDEMLFLSARSALAPGRPIRGGIPIIFPQFADTGPLPMHGLLRTLPWTLTETGTEPTGAVFAVFSCRDTPETRALWPHQFSATFRVTLDDALTTALAITNTGTSSFPFQTDLHSYLRVGDVRRVSVEGLSGARYLDRSANGVERTERTTPLTIDGEVDRLYPGCHSPIRVVDPSRNQVTVVESWGFTDTVVWNPGELKGRTTINLADGEYLQLLGIESGAIVPSLVLDAGRQWTGSQRIRVE